MARTFFGTVSSLHLISFLHLYIYIIYIQSSNTALVIACWRNDLAMVSALLSAGANPNVCNEVRVTTLLFINYLAGHTNLGWSNPTIAGYMEEKYSHCLGISGSWSGCGLHE